MFMHNCMEIEQFHETKDNIIWCAIGVYKFIVNDCD